MDSAIRPAKEGDVAELVAFFKEVYQPGHIMADKNYLAWQYRDIEDNQFYPGYSSLLLFYGKEMVGHLGLIPYSFDVGGRMMKGAFLASGILKKELRGTGAGALLVKEAEKYFDLLYTVGYNERIAPVYKLYNWSGEYFLKRWIYKKRNAEIKNNIPVRQIRNFDSEWDGIWEKLKNNYKITIDRSSKYLNQRFSNNPFIDYVIFYAKNSGYLVLRKENGNEFNAGRIVDFISGPESATGLLCAAIDFAEKEKMDFLDFFCSSSAYAGALKDAGFEEYDPAQNSEPPVFILPTDRSRLKVNYIFKYINPELKKYNAEDWFIAKADGDKDRPSKNYVK